MARSAARPRDPLSDHLRSRLASLSPTDSVVVILALAWLDPAEPRTKRLTSEQRQAMIAATRERARTGQFPAIDAILRDNGGRRLGDEPTALGTIAVETTANGVRALAESEHVAAILDDQPVHGIQ